MSDILEKFESMKLLYIFNFQYLGGYYADDASNPTP